MKPLGALPAWRPSLSILVLVACIIVGVWRIVLTYPIIYQTIDEPFHIAAGLHWLARGENVEALHPPLARMAAGLLPYMHGLRPLNGFDNPAEEGDVVLHFRNDFPGNLGRARAGILPFFVLGTVMVWLWARHLAGGVAAGAAVVLYTTLPPILAHSGLATTDMPVTAAIIGTLYAFTRWLETPRLLNSALLGVGIGLAVVSKFSALLFLPACAAAVLLAVAVSIRPSWLAIYGEVSRRWRGGLLVFFVAFLVTWTGYQFQVGSLTGPRWRPHRALERFEGFFDRHEGVRKVAYALVEAPIPAPDVIVGVGRLRQKNREGYFTFFLGEFSASGWWYFFPVLLAVKTPIAFLFLLVPGIISLWRWGAWQSWWQRLSPIVCAAAILVACIPTRINLGLRHVLPIYGPLSVIAGVGLADLLGRSRQRRTAIVAGIGLLLWQIVCSARAHPDYLANFNAFAFGHPERITTDSDLDWGHDLWRLRDRLRQAGATRVALGYFWGRWEGGGLPVVQPLIPYQPTNGWVAITEHTMVVLGEKYRRQAGARTGAFEWLESYPYERVGKSIRLYHIPENG